MDLWLAFLRALWLFLPCYMANMAPVGAARLFPKWDAPLDGGRSMRSGVRFLGPNKTWRGLAAGTVAGAGTAGILALLARGAWADLDFGISSGVPLVMVLAFGAILGCMALVGDAVKSHAKRRVGRKEGSSWFPFDQLDFVVGGLVGAWMGSPLLGGWSIPAYFGDATMLALLVFMTPALHWLSSVLAYRVGWKKAPW